MYPFLLDVQHHTSGSFRHAGTNRRCRSVQINGLCNGIQPNRATEMTGRELVCHRGPIVISCWLHPDVCWSSVDGKSLRCRCFRRGVGLVYLIEGFARWLVAWLESRSLDPSTTCQPAIWRRAKGGGEIFNNPPPMANICRMQSIVHRQEITAHKAATVCDVCSPFVTHCSLSSRTSTLHVGQVMLSPDQEIYCQHAAPYPPAKQITP